MTRVIASADASLDALLEQLQRSGLRPARLVIVELASQPERTLHRDLLERVHEAWLGCFKDHAATSRSALRTAWERASPEAQALDLALREIRKVRTDPLTAARLGRWLRVHLKVPTRVGRFERCGEQDHSALWRLVTP